MMRPVNIRNLFLVGLLYAIMLVSCDGDRNGIPEKPYANNLGIKPAKLAQIDTIHYTTVEWMDPDRDFGTVNEGDSVSYDFIFKNTGRHPLFISGVKPSCGCTIARYPDEAIMPGKQGVMKVHFNTYNQPGTVHKTIIVTTNTSNGVKHLLTISGQINQKTKQNTR